MWRKYAKKLTALICSASMLFGVSAAALADLQGGAAMAEEGSADMAEEGSAAMAEEGAAAMEEEGSAAMAEEGAAAMEEEGGAAIAEEGREPERQADLHLGIDREWELMEKAGKSIDQWDEEISLMKKEGMRNELTEALLEKADPEVTVLRSGDKVYYIGPNPEMGQVKDAQEAYRLIYRLVGMLGGTPNTDLRLWHVLSVNDKRIYVFYHISDSQGVLGSVVKLVVGEKGDVEAVFSSLQAEADQEEKLAGREEIEAAVLSRLSKEGREAEICEGRTERIIYTPVDMEDLAITDEEEEDVPERLLWVVYTGSEEEENPYLAHYVKLDGSYLYSIPVKEPGDEEARCGFKAEPVFEGMTADEWTGELTDVYGETHTVTVPVMYSEADKCWYLGSLERGVAVADYAAAAYDEEHPLLLVSSKDNQDWEEDDLYMLYHYIKAWDFYADLGWEGPDGEGTDVIILKDLCTPEGNPYENACSIGRVGAWQMFGYTSKAADGSSLGLVRALDVMAHEYTHTFTSTLMVDNLYLNDMGAINEAMSDIMGNMVEQICGETDDSLWLIGENTGLVIRSMSWPNDYQQPSYVWDVFYGAKVDEASIANDRGGVHSNSSLLNRIAALLCTEAGMTLKEAVSFWIMTACGMTPGTDYPQMEALLGWALEASGNEGYADALAGLIEEERLSQTELPRELRLGRKLMKLRLPDTEAFDNPNWAMISLQLDKGKMKYLLGAFIRAGYGMIKDHGEYTRVAAIMNELIDKLHMEGRSLKLDPMESVDENQLLDAALDVIFYSLDRIIVPNYAWKAADLDEIVFVQEDNPTLYLLINLRDAGTKINGMAVLIGSHWYDLGDFARYELPEEGEGFSQEDLMQMFNDIMALTQTIMENKQEDTRTILKKAGLSMKQKMDNALKLADFMIDGVDVVSDLAEGKEISLDKLLSVPVSAQYLPSDGLEDVELIEKR